jgi:hypothetical protein
MAMSRSATRSGSADGGLGLHTLDRGECLRLLEQGVIGRVVYTAGAMPAAQPVNYAMDGDEIIFRTEGGTKMELAVTNAVVAFEIDEIDVATRSGWSVLAVGEAYHVSNPDRLSSLQERIPPPWAAGRSVYTIAIPTTQLTGRRLRSADNVER